MKTQHTGRRGEALARRYLRQRGYDILATNWHCALGELDIVARLAGTCVFVEVRTRRSADPQDALASITPRKRERLLAAVWAWLEQHEAMEANWRIDVIAVTPGAKPDVVHVEDALDW